MTNTSTDDAAALKPVETASDAATDVIFSAESASQKEGKLTGEGEGGSKWPTKNKREHSFFA